MHFTKFHEVFFELFRSQLEVKATDKDLTLWIGELYRILWVITAAHTVLLHDLDVGVWLLDVLPIVCHHEVVVLMMVAATVASMVVMVAATSHVSTLTTTLVIIGRFDIDTLVENVVSLSLVLPNYASFDLLSFVLVIKTE